MSASAQQDGAGSRSYHGQPLIKEPVWTWEIPFYFFTGGLAGASAGLAELSRLRGNDELARRAWIAALAGVSTSPVFLISDLGKPARFLNMLRMFKVTSPMSVGSWILAASGTTTAIATVHAWTGLLPRAAALARPAAAVLGLPLSTYTAALIANTSVPVWHEARGSLPYVFGSGAALSAGAAAVALTPSRHAAPARRLALAGAVSEVVCKQAMERKLGDLGEPYHQGAGAKFGHVGQVCIAAGAALLARRGRTSRSASIAAGALLSAGALSARWSVFKAGFQSAATPEAIVGPQRERINRGETKGASRTSSKVSAPDRALATPATTL